MNNTTLLFYQLLIIITNNYWMNEDITIELIDIAIKISLRFA